MEPDDKTELIKRRLFAVAVVAPLAGLSVGVDGGDIFQILAAETLELDPRAVGTALLLGALSIPVQIWATKMPLQRARQNLRIFMSSLGVMSLVTAAVVAFAQPGSLVAASVLAVAVVAEVAVSVLFATSWQPLISYALSQKQRQFIVGPGNATSGAALLLAVLLFGELDRSGRTLFLLVLGVVAIVVALTLKILPPPPQPEPTATIPTTTTTPKPVGETASVVNVFVALAASALASWPLLIYYASVVMWPGGNLGLLAGAMALGGIVASALWRDVGDRLITVVRLAAAVVALSSISLVAIPHPIDRSLGVAALLAATAFAGAGGTVIRIGIMELAHRRVDTTNSVKVMTMFDVVGSTSSQVGAFCAGFLVVSSIGSAAPMNPYQIWIAVTAAALLIAVARFHPTPGQRPEGRLTGSGVADH